MNSKAAGLGPPLFFSEMAMAPAGTPRAFHRFRKRPTALSLSLEAIPDGRLRL